MFFIVVVLKDMLQMYMIFFCFTNIKEIVCKIKSPQQKNVLSIFIQMTLIEYKMCHQGFINSIIYTYKFCLCQFLYFEIIEYLV